MNNINNNLTEEIKLNIAMSEFTKNYKKIEKNNNYLFLKKVAILIISTLLIIIGSVQAKNIINHFSNRKIHYDIYSISNSIENGYSKNIDMDYIYSDGIGLKINSLLISDTDINIMFDFKLNDKINLTNNNIEYTYILYDDNNELYNLRYGTDINPLEKTDKNLNKNITIMHSQETYTTFTNDNIITSNLISSKSPFPKAKKLYLEIYGIGYLDENYNYKKLTNSSWKIELNVPEKLYLNTSYNYVQETINNDIVVKQAIVSDTSAIFNVLLNNYKNNGTSNNIIITVTNENEVAFKTNWIAFDGELKNELIFKLPLTKREATNTLYLNIKLNNNEYLVKLNKK